MSKRIPALLASCFGIGGRPVLPHGPARYDTPIVAGIIQDRFATIERIGVFQSGVIGYFNDNIVNLDGKVDHEALQARKTYALPDFADRKGIDALIEWRGWIETRSTFLPTISTSTFAPVRSSSSKAT